MCYEDEAIEKGRNAFWIYTRKKNRNVEQSGGKREEISAKIREEKGNSEREKENGDVLLIIKRHI